MKTLPLNTLALLLVMAVALSLPFGSCKKDEKAPPLKNLSFQIGHDTLFRKGETKKFKCAYDPMSGTKPDIRWESSDENVVEVKKDGTATAVNTGMATITVWVNDGTGLTSSRTVYVFEKPTISIQSISDITYCSANFTLQYDMGGGVDANSSCGFVWDTVPTLDTAKVVGRYRATTISTQQSVDLFDADKKFYIRAYAKTPLDKVFSDSVILQTKSVPADLLGNYMLNYPLAYGYVVKHKDWIYYSNRNDIGKLYKIKTDLTGKTKVNDVYRVNSLGIIPPYIYLSGNDTFGYIMRMKLDGTNLYIYQDANGNYVSRIELILGKYIYPSKGYFRISTDGKEKIPNKGNGYTNTYNGKLYFYKSFTLNECNLEGDEVKELYRGTPFHLGVYENAAYFHEELEFKKFDLSNPSIVQILPINAANYNIANYTIFFSNRDDGYKLYKADLNGNLKTKLCDDKVDEISVIDDWLYYYSSANLYRIKQNGSGRQLVD